MSKTRKQMTPEERMMKATSSTIKAYTEPVVEETQKVQEVSNNTQTTTRPQKVGRPKVGAGREKRVTMDFDRDILDLINELERWIPGNKRQVVMALLNYSLSHIGATNPQVIKRNNAEINDKLEEYRIEY